MTRPYIICHMVTSIDGKVTGDFLSRSECEKATEIYYEINRNYKADGFICGCETMQESFAGKEDAPRYKYKNVDVPSGDFIGDKNAKFFAVSFDKHGHICWKSNYIKDEDMIDLFESNKVIGNFLRKYSPKLYQNEEFKIDIINNITTYSQFLADLQEASNS